MASKQFNPPKLRKIQILGFRKDCAWKKGDHLKLGQELYAKIDFRDDKNFFGFYFNAETYGKKKMIQYAYPVKIKFLDRKVKNDNTK